MRAEVDPGMEERAAGYHAGPWPGEDGGPARRQAPRADVPVAFGPGVELEVTSRSVISPTMTVLRDPGEVYVLTHTLAMMAGPEGVTAVVERIDPHTLEPVVSSPVLPGGPMWPGGMLAHADGSLYVTFGRWCHRLSADCEVLAARELPVDRPYNSLVALDDGTLVMKDFVADGSACSRLVALAPGDLAVLDELELPEGSIARLSAVGSTIVVVGDHTIVRVVWDGARLALDEGWATRYRTQPGQTFGWDAVVVDGSVWFLDDGAGSEGYTGTLRGVGTNEAPLRLWRVPWDGAPATSIEICGRTGGIVANPPLVDPSRRVVVGYDSGNGVIAAWRYGDPGDDLQPLWRFDQDQAGHMLRLAGADGRGALVSYDHDASGGETVVLRDLETGEEWARAAIASPMQSVLFPSVGWDGDVYVSTFSTLARVSAAR